MTSALEGADGALRDGHRVVDDDRLGRQTGMPTEGTDRTSRGQARDPTAEPVNWAAPAPPASAPEGARSPVEPPQRNKCPTNT